MTKRRALVLFAHGARDPRWAEPFQRLQKLTQAQVPDALVALAFLELMQPTLPELVPQLIHSGCDDVTVVPVFFGQGGHVVRDLPLLIQRLRSAHPELELKLARAIGEDAEVLQAMAQYCVRSFGNP